MKKRILRRVTGLLLGSGLVAFAVGPGQCVAQIRSAPDQKGLALSSAIASAVGQAECAAQTGAESQRAELSLSAAIEEVRRSPFHAGAAAVPPRGVALARTATGDTFASLSLRTGSQEQPDDTAVPGFVVPLTFVASLASHFAFYYGGNILLAGLPVPVVAGPSALNGVHPGTALGASLLGYLPVALLYWRFVVFRPRGGGPIVLAGSLIHAGIVVGLVNRSAFGRK